MAKRTPHPTDPPDDVFRRVRLSAPGRSGGLTEFAHAVAAILARLDAEERNRVQSDTPQESGEERREEP